MDKRIQELALQAGYKPVGTFADDLMEIYNKKFAELIVKECADIAEKWYSDYPSDDRLLSDAVKQHFGVKE